MTLTAKGRLACSNLLNIEGMIAIVYSHSELSGFASYAYDETGRFITSDAGMFQDPFLFADNQVKSYANHTSSVILFDPKDEECPPSLRECDGIVYSRNWQEYAIARFEFEQAEKDREERRQHEHALSELVKAFCRALQGIGVPAEQDAITLYDTQFTNKENPKSLPQYLPVFEIGGMAFVHTLGDGERLIGLLSNPNEITLATRHLDGDFIRIIRTPAELGAALAMNGEPTK